MASERGVEFGARRRDGAVVPPASEQARLRGCVLRPLRARRACHVRDGGWWLAGYGTAELGEIPGWFGGCRQQAGELPQLRSRGGGEPGCGGLLLRA
jgi:hypothetical protein